VGQLRTQVTLLLLMEVRNFESEIKIIAVWDVIQCSLVYCS
jgi:hypothetical protein